MDGRDIGTFVLPDADVKIISHGGRSRACRTKIPRAYRKKASRLNSRMFYRAWYFANKNDSTREFMPLKKADDAILIDTSDLSLDESVDAVIKCIGDRIK